MRLRVGAASDVGRVRERNEDSFVAQDPLYAVADGLGGHQGGDVASKLALEILARSSPWDEDGIHEKLRDRVREANEAVHEKAASEANLAGMGTTLTALIAGTGRFYLAHVGDSRAYLLRDGELRPLTEDHTLVRRLVNEGKLTLEDAEIHPQRSILTRALGVEDEVEVDLDTVEIRSGDRLLLCSDGLTSMVGDADIRELLESETDPQAVSDGLVEAANAAGGQDNITVVVVDVLDDDGASAGAAVTQVGATVAPPAPGPGGSKEKKPSRWRGRLIKAGVALLLVTGLLIGGRAYIDRQWYVGVNDGSVAIYRGIPVTILWLDLSRPVETTTIPADQAMRLQTWAGLEEGITAGSETEARQIIRQIQQDVEARMEAAAPS